MRILLLALLAVFTLAPHAQAAMAWTEAEEDGRHITRWTRGADLNEVYAAAHAVSGPNYNVLAVCRQPGYFAFVGSDFQPQRGVSCGFTDDAAAVYAARLKCEHEGGRCDVERVGYDEGVSLVGNTSKLPTDLPGTTASAGKINPRVGPAALQD
jgi:hypothetical protein